jgi:hypothetical protein
MVLLPFSGVQAEPESLGDWTNVAPGIDYQLFIEAGPNRVHVARMERSAANLAVQSSIAYGKLARGLETVSAMARRYNEANIYWEAPDVLPEDRWTFRNQVVVAVNGAYLESWWTSLPQGGQIQNGWYTKRLSGTSGSGKFGFRFDRTPFIADCVEEPPDKQRVYFPAPVDTTINITGINTARGSDSLIVYTPQYDLRTPSTGIQFEVLVEMPRPNLTIPPPQYVSGKVVAIRSGGPPFVIPFDHLVLSATGSVAAQLQQASQVGGEIQMSQEIDNYVGEECNYVNPVTWTKTMTALEGEYFYLRNGVYYPNSNSGAVNVHPRTSVAYDSNYVYFIVVDGRAPGYSVGMTIAQLANFVISRLAATHALAFDGGGSSTMVINGQVVNRPSDPCGTLFFPNITVGADTYTPPFVYDPPVNFYEFNNTCERKVGSGLMMVIIEPGETSNTFAVGQTAVTDGAVNVRRGPGNNYDIIATLQENTQVVIQPHAGNLQEGIFAKDNYWWKISFNGMSGWVIEDALRSTAQTVDLWRYRR